VVLPASVGHMVSISDGEVTALILAGGATPRVRTTARSHEPRLGHMNQHIQGFVPLPLGATHVKTPKTRKSDWLVVRSDWIPACR